MIEKNTNRQNDLRNLKKKLKVYCNKLPLYLEFYISGSNVFFIIDMYGDKIHYEYKYDFYYSLKDNIGKIGEELKKHFPYIIFIEKIKKEFNPFELNDKISKGELSIQDIDSFYEEKIETKAIITKIDIKKDEFILEMNNKKLLYKSKLPVSLLIRKIVTENMSYEVFNEKSYFIKELKSFNSN